MIWLPHDLFDLRIYLDCPVRAWMDTWVEMTGPPEVVWLN